MCIPTLFSFGRMKTKARFIERSAKVEGIDETGSIDDEITHSRSFFLHVVRMNFRRYFGSNRTLNDRLSAFVKA